VPFLTEEEIMTKNKLIDKFKEGVSVDELEGFARRHTTEVFSTLALIIGAISSSFDFFTGPKLTIFFLTIGILLGIFFPAPVEKALKQLYTFTFKQEKMTEIILGCVKILIAIFIPFINFGLTGLLAGTSYHYYIRHAQIVNDNKPKEFKKNSHDEEHD
jgi:hypothetical protein